MSKKPAVATKTVGVIFEWDVYLKLNAGAEMTGMKLAPYIREVVLRYLAAPKMPTGWEVPTDEHGILKAPGPSDEERLKAWELMEKDNHLTKVWLTKHETLDGYVMAPGVHDLSVEEEESFYKWEQAHPSLKVADLRGRPCLLEDDRLDERVSTRLTTEERCEFDRYCERLGIGVSNMLRAFIREKLMADDEERFVRLHKTSTALQIVPMVITPPPAKSKTANTPAAWAPGNTEFLTNPDALLLGPEYISPELRADLDAQVERARQSKLPTVPAQSNV